MNRISIFQEYKTLTNELQPIYGKREATAMARLVIEQITGDEITQIFANLELTLTSDQQSLIQYYLSQLKLQKPIQYILGKTDFFGIELQVNADVLIPRPETEELVSWIIESNEVNSPSILDIGTGSGCIAISLAKNIANANVFAMDISEQAIETARQNAANAGVNVMFSKTNILAPPAQILGSPFHIIVSNPPYVRESEKQHMKPNVLDNEPSLALFVSDNDPLIFYKAIARFAAENLKNNGLVYCEINEALGAETASIFAKANFTNISIQNDINDKQRMICARKGN
ncbi:MAG: peptide chain release factor N(5)-glutamine methyltransferase [Tenuifilaceae bacterium]|nr:peptide chain release factor N(5)-glutamine methyltransferase [Tenuifilaceae bacterium]